MKNLSKSLPPEEMAPGVIYDKQENLPEKIIQFGEGNFLRGFVDWMIHEMNKQGVFNGKVVAIQPTPHGKVVPKLNAQDGLYTLTLRGMVNGEEVDKSEIISSISRGINPYADWEELLKVAESPDIQFIFSNTTEAGLTYLKEDFDEKLSPLSFPGKVASFLYHRFKVMNGSQDAGLTIIPCELVENNGEVLKELVLRYSADWSFPEEFTEWVQTCNLFCNTLVDRIVTGYPKDNAEEFGSMLGYEDILLTVGEPYHMFAIEADEEVSERLPFAKAGLNVKWGDVTPHRNMKVRLLNGPHTMMFAACYLSGADTVLDAMRDQDLREFVENGLYKELLPHVAMEQKEKQEFADSVIERFLNPYTKHYLNDIGLNAVYKFKSRLIPSLQDYIEENNQLPKSIVFSLAALIVYYRPFRAEGEFLVGKRNETEYVIRDNKEAIALFSKVWGEFEQKNVTAAELVEEVLQAEDLWGVRLMEFAGLKESVSQYTEEILSNGMKESVKNLLQKVNK